MSADSSGVTIVVTDDGCGGACAGAGTGLGGLTDRVHALGGQLALDSDPGRGTKIIVTLPLRSGSAQRARAGQVGQDREYPSVA